MNDQSSFGAIAFTRFQAMQAQHVQLKDKLDQQEQKQSESNNITSIELPAAIKNLITGSEYWIKAKSNRYKKLIREGHLGNLLELAAIAPTRENPANWFAKVCSVKAWERTLNFLKKLHDVRKKAEQIMGRIGQEVSDRMKKFVYKQIWAGKSVERHAVAAQEIGENRHKLFAWLCKREGQGRAAQNTA